MRKSDFSEYLRSFDLKTLFNELGWNHFTNQLPVAVNEELFLLKGIAEKKGFVIMQCESPVKIPVSNIRKQIEGKLAKSHYEHLIIYTDQAKTQQIWQLAIKEENKPKQVREIIWHCHQDSEILFQRLRNLLFTLDEEEKITIIDVKQRISENFARNTEQVTKKFYDLFKKQHTAFLDFIEGIDDQIANKDNSNKQWYASLMLNRLMFCYFIQKKGFLDQDIHYLHNKLKACQEQAGNDNFYNFYRSFLLELFHDGLGKPIGKRKAKLPVEMGKIPYLNGGLFDVHELERQFDEIQIDDDAFKRIFDFFDQWNWHLDNSVEASGRDINPDVIGYIFEKYINDRAAMGAYYTKEDITDYIGKNTIIPFLFDETERHYKEAFKPDGELWQFLKQSGDTYIYDAVKYGVPETDKLFDDLPNEVKAGFLPDVEQQIVAETTSPHLWEIRKVWNQKTPQSIGLPTEIYRELIERRKRYADIKQKIDNGEITRINDLITYNLNIRQFTQDFLETTEDPDFIKAFFKSIQKVTILDPTCGSGAFLFAALNILEPLYETCIDRVAGFVEEAANPENFEHLSDSQKKSWQSINHEKSWFRQTLAEINSEQHYNLQYFIYKSIILNNLHGVDIMREAVEIAKLRLFLKLVATVDVNPRKENFGLEPLPDIDFNIRAGNTLVGFATEKELFETIQKKDGLFAQAVVDEFKEESALVSKAYQHFQDSQLISDKGSDGFKQAKADLNQRLNALNHKLNVYLAINYGIDAQLKPKAFDAWLASHQPFHWFAEFYRIVAANGGFDVIIGNPPYVEYSKVRKTYTSNEKSTKTISCGNIYAMVFERSMLLTNFIGKVGFIIPISLGSTKRMQPLLQIIKESSTNYWSSFFAERPSKLFNGAEVLLNISILDKKKSNNVIVKNYTTGLIKWASEYRDALFPTISYINFSNQIRNYLIPKYSSALESIISKKIFEMPFVLAHTVSTIGDKRIFYRIGGGRYWKIFTTFQPTFSVNGIQTASSRENYIYFDSDILLNAALTSLSSSTFFWYFQITTNGRDLNPFDLNNFPFNFQMLSENPEITTLARALMVDYSNNKAVKEKISEQTGHVVFEEFYPRKSKPIIDQIDTVLSQHYGFTEEELDFIINYDIKYRMSKALFGEEDGGEDEGED